MNLEPGPIHVLTVAELADDAFLKAEHVRNLGMMNTPTDFDKRREAFVKLAEAQAAAASAQRRLYEAIAGAHLLPRE